MINSVRISFSRTFLAFVILLSAFIFEVAESNAAETLNAPIENYPANIRQLATAMIEPGWSTNRLMNIARDRIQNWAELAEACDDLSNSGGDFNAEACDTFAYSYRASRRIRHIRSCERIERWKNETIDDLNSALSTSGSDNSELAIATEAAIAQLNFELEHICDFNDDGFDGLYSSFHQVVYGEDRPSAAYLKEQLQVVDSRGRAESFSTRTIILQ